MAFSTQREFINVPSCLCDNSKAPKSSGRRNNDDYLRSDPPQKAYSSYLPDLSNIWNRVSQIGKSNREALEKLKEVSSETDSGINSEPCHRMQSARNNYNNERLPPSTELEIHGESCEDILQALKEEGKLTVETIMEIIQKYENVVMDLLTDGVVLTEEDIAHEKQKLVDTIDQQSIRVFEYIAKMSVGEELKTELTKEVKTLIIALRALLNTSKQETEVARSQLQKVTMDRENLHMSLEKLSNVEEKIMNLKSQAATANGLQRNCRDLARQLDEAQCNNRALVEFLREAKKTRKELEVTLRKDIEEVVENSRKWKQKATCAMEMNQRQQLELDKWKMHSSRLSVELDKATERILRMHETKRKLYYSESMRTELENQIEEMMQIINELNEQKTAAFKRNEPPPECQRILSNLLDQSKTTLQSILANVTENALTDFPPGNDALTSEVEKLKEENSKLKKDNILSCRQIRRLEASLEELQHQLNQQRSSKDNRRPAKSPPNQEDDDRIVALKRQLEKCQEENRNLKNSADQKLAAKSCSRRFCKEIKAVKKELADCRKENVNLKKVMNANCSESCAGGLFRSNNDVIVTDLLQETEVSKPLVLESMGTFSDIESQTIHKRIDDQISHDAIGLLPLGSQHSGVSSDEEDTASEICTRTYDLDSQHRVKGDVVNLEEPLDSDSDMSSGSDALSRTIDDVAEVQALLKSKDSQIRRMQQECSTLRKTVSKLGDDQRKTLEATQEKYNLAKSLSIARLEKQLIELKEELNEQKSLVESAREQLRVQNAELQKSKELLKDLQEHNTELIQENIRLEEEISTRDAMKTEKDRLNGSLRDQDKELEDVQQELIITRRDAERYRSEFNERVRKMLEEKARLETENGRLAKELEELDEVVDEVAAEREKNKRLEQLISDMEAKLEKIYKAPNTSVKQADSTHYLQLVEKLKSQVELETNINNQLREDLTSRQAEIEDLRRLVNIRGAHFESNGVPTQPDQMAALEKNRVPVSAKAEYSEMVTELRSQLESEKIRYRKLNSKFAIYTVRIEDLERKLQEKQILIEKEMHDFSETLKVTSSQSSSSQLELQLANEIEKRKRFLTKLIIELIRNEVLNSRIGKQQESLEKMETELNAKESCLNYLLHRFKKEDQELNPSSKSPEDRSTKSLDNSSCKNTTVDRPSSLIDIVQGFQDINDHLKEQLSLERQKARKLQNQTGVDNFRVEELKTKLKKSRMQIALLQNQLKRRETTIVELQKGIEEATGPLTKITDQRNKEVQTDDTTIDLQNQLDSQVKRNFEIACDYSREIANTQTTRNDLKQSQKEVRRLLKCIRELEKTNEELKLENKDLTKEVENKKEQLLIKVTAARQTCEMIGCNRSQPCKNPQCLNYPPQDNETSKNKKMTTRTARLTMDRMHRICATIQEAGIDALNIRDLTHLHREVYNAGRKLRLSDSESAHEKCWEFVANLPPIPTNKEEKIMARVNYLETELDNANQVLQHLKKEYEREARMERHRGGENKKLPSTQNIDPQLFNWSQDNNRSC